MCGGDDCMVALCVCCLFVCIVSFGYSKSICKSSLVLLCKTIVTICLTIAYTSIFHLSLLVLVCI